VNDVESTDVILNSEEFVNESPAHIVDFVHEIGAQVEVAAMIMYAIDSVVTRLLMAAAREDVHFMTAPIQGSGQLGDMNADSPDGDPMQRLPRKQSDLHVFSPCCLASVPREALPA
jgi:hypothetical protein